MQPMRVALRANHLEDQLYYTSPAGYISLVINLGIYLGIVMAMPWVLYQIWLFVAPGLYKHERSAAAGFIISSMFLVSLRDCVRLFHHCFRRCSTFSSALRTTARSSR